MAYPPQLTGPGEVLEDFTHGDLSAVPSNFAHNDMHSNNVLFGEFEPQEPEHAVTPVLKVIDLERFGVPTAWGQ
ncbi:hypothetical protein F5Y02DRAFT_392817 [Annulohypoxylon stygium]|nr:hypothetical protein F5Y02DRAFT_392817 [Annulohypoxylon stygium]